MNLTYNIELLCSEEIKLQIIRFLTAQQQVVNELSKHIFKDKPILSLKIIHDEHYYKLRAKFPDLPSQIIIKCEQEIIQSYKAVKANKHKLTEPINKHNLSLRLDERLYSSFTQSSIKLNIGAEKREILNFKLYDKVKDMFSKYKPSNPLIFVRDNRVFLAASFEVPETLPIDESALGVDLGIRRLFTTSDGNMLKSTEYIKAKRRIRYQKRELQKKNTRSANRKLKKIRRKERNFSKNYTHNVANLILKTDKSIIILEDLAQIKKKKNKFQNINRKSQIPFFMLLTFLSYKAPLKGKKVVTVNPYMTSQDDYRGLERGTRKGCRYYGVDNVILDADGNAANNIVKRIYSDHPFSFVPRDGRMNLLGRVLINHPIVSDE